MPNRIIRESCRTSATLFQLSHGAERCFWRLTTVADDYGRFEADARVVKAMCFPLWADRIKVLEVERWLDEMRACGLVTTYVVNGKHFGFFPTWDTHQRVRAKHSKYPPPTPDTICGHVLSSAAEKREARSEKREVEKRESEQPPPPAAVSASDSFKLFWDRYPKKKAREDAEKAWRKLAPGPELLETILDAIDRHRKGEEWLRDGGRYVPYPATWLRARRWEDEDAPTLIGQVDRARTVAASIRSQQGRSA